MSNISCNDSEHIIWYWFCLVSEKLVIIKHCEVDHKNLCLRLTDELCIYATIKRDMERNKISKHISYTLQK